MKKTLCIFALIAMSLPSAIGAPNATTTEAKYPGGFTWSIGNVSDYLVPVYDGTEYSPNLKALQVERHVILDKDNIKTVGDCDGPSDHWAITENYCLETADYLKRLSDLVERELVEMLASDRERIEKSKAGSLMLHAREDMREALKKLNSAAVIMRTERMK